MSGPYSSEGRPEGVRRGMPRPATSKGRYGEFVIDLRSDTLTQPTPGMRKAIAEAAVGDEQKREDPTVIALEERAAELLGQEEAIFVPTATMANQIALRTLSQPGDEVVAESMAHVFRYELGGPAVHSGLAMKALHTDTGIFTAEQVRDPLTPAG